MAEPTEGSLEPGRKAVTLKDLAQRLQLSTATVSLVLNRSPAAQGLASETRARVLEAARESGYRPNLLARSLRSGRSSTVGVLVRDVVDSYAAVVLAGVESYLLQESYVYLVASHQSRASLRDEYLQLLEDRSVEGFILVNTVMSAPPPLPTVSVSGHQRLAGVTNVVIDHPVAADLALSHLIGLGHRRIAFFKGQPGSADTEERWSAILAAAAGVGLEVLPELTAQLGGADGESFAPEKAYEEGYACGRRLLDLEVAFTALFAFNDVSAIGAMRAFRDVGLRVPEDVSVMGFDDIPNAAFNNPKLTTVRQPLWQMGETAGRILVERLAGGAEFPDFVTIEPELVVRASTGPAPAPGTAKEPPELEK
jgi:LacI family transcriptional regulator